MRRVGDARPPEALRRAAEAAEHAGVELGGDEDEDVVAEEGERRPHLRLGLAQLVHGGPVVRVAAHCVGNCRSKPPLGGLSLIHI